MAGTFNCSLVSPEEKLLDDEVTYASIPAWDGQIGIAPGRAPLLVKLGVGTLRLDFVKGGTRWYLIEGGFAQMVGKKLTLLSNKATPAEKIIGSDAARDLETSLKVTAVTDDEVEAKEMATQAAREKRRLAALSSERGI